MRYKQLFRVTGAEHRESGGCTAHPFTKGRLCLIKSVLIINIT